VTNQEKKRWLRRYRGMKGRSRWLRAEIARWRAAAERCTTSFSLSRGAGSDDRLQRAIDRIDELERQLLDQIAANAEECRLIEAAVAAIGDDRLREVLERRYIEGLRWEEIAERMGYADRHVRRLHGDALTALEPPE